MGYTVIPANAQNQAKSTWQQISEGIAPILGAYIGSKMKQKRRNAYKEAMAGKGFEEEITVDSEGNETTKYSKPKNRDLKTRIYESMGYDKMAPEELAERAKSDEVLQSLIGQRKGTVKSSAPKLETTSKTQTAIGKLDKMLYGDEATGEAGMVGSEDEAELLRQYVVSDIPQLEAAGLDIKQILKRYAPKLSEYNMRDELPEAYRQYVQDIPKEQPKKKFDWQSIMSPVNIGGNLRVR